MNDLLKYYGYQYQSLLYDDEFIAEDGKPDTLNNDYIQWISIETNGGYEELWSYRAENYLKNARI